MVDKQVRILYNYSWQKIKESGRDMGFSEILKTIENFVWGIPLLVIIIAGGLLLTVRLRGIQIRRLNLALKWMFTKEEGAT